MHFKNLPNELKPREKAIIKGIKELSDLELLALIIAFGSQNSDVLTTSATLFKKYYSLTNISNLSYYELIKEAGIGKAKGLALCSAFEIAKRLNNIASKLLFTHFNDLAKFALKIIGEYDNENFLIILTSENQIINYKILSSGDRTSTKIDPIEIIRYVLKNNSYSFYCFHNHPSLDITPSQSDKQITQRLKHLSYLHGLSFMGHFTINAKGATKRIS